MSEDEEKPLTLSREDLYELVWSKPMRELAKDFGISDVTLAKRCRRLAIPVPGRGYWARVDARRERYRPQLPKREPQWFAGVALTIGPSRDGSADYTANAHVEGIEWSDGGLSMAQFDEAWIQDGLPRWGEERANGSAASAALIVGTSSP